MVDIGFPGLAVANFLHSIHTEKAAAVHYGFSGQKYITLAADECHDSNNY